jgi:hypothetical protein
LPEESILTLSLDVKSPPVENLIGADPIVTILRPLDAVLYAPSRTLSARCVNAPPPVYPEE